MRLAITIRLVLIGLSAVLGVVLLARGSLLMGGLVTAMAVARLAMVGSHLRRAAFANQVAIRRGRVGSARDRFARGVRDQ